MTKEELAKFIEKSVEWLRREDMGCCTINLGEGLCVAVGWGYGYDEGFKDCAILSQESPKWAIVVGLKASESDDMKTDYEFLATPYNEDDCFGYELNPKPSGTDYEAFASYLLEAFDYITTNFNVAKDGHLTTKGK